MALTATLAAAVLWRRDRRILALAAMVLGTAASAPILAATVGIPVTRYYPSKLLWISAVLGLAPLGVWLSRWTDRIWKVRGRTTVPARSAVVVFSALFLLICAVNPARALYSWARVDGSKVLSALRAPNAGSAQVVWLPGEPNESTIARILLDFYRVEHHEPFLPQQPLALSEECALLRLSSSPTVLSTGSAADVRTRFACVPDVQVVPAAAPAGADFAP
jgi:hypothetical protein